MRLVQQERTPAFGGGEFAREFVNGAAQRAGVAGVCVLVHAQQCVAGQHQVRPGNPLGQRGLTGGGFGDDHDLRLGQEAFRLRRPVGDDGGRGNHEEGRERLDALTALGGTFGDSTVLLNRVGEQSESLHGLTQTHIVGENTAQPLLVQEGQPLETLHLVGAQDRLQAGGYRAARNNLAGSLLARGLLERGGILSALVRGLFGAFFGAFLGILQALNQLQ